MKALKNLLSRTSLQLGIKLLLVIVFTEALIMTCYHFIGINSASLWAGVSDALLLGIISSIVIFNQVIKPLKQAKQQNDLFNTLVNNLDVGVVVTDPHQQDHPITYVNPAFTRITGYHADELIGKNPRLLYGDDVDQNVLQQTRQAMRQEKSIRVLQRNRRKDGSSFWNDLHLNPILNAYGQVQLWVGLFHDVSETKELEKENLRWASALQQSDEAVCIFDAEGHIEFSNEAFCRNARLSATDMAGFSVLNFWDKASPEFKALTNSMQQATSWSGHHKRYRADQTCYDALTSITPIRDEQGVLSFVAVHRDISDMVEMENKLRQSQKMEAVGMLVSGIAHDFNNVLAGMLGNLYLVRSRLKDSPQLAERIEDVEKQGYGAVGMVRQLLSFSRKDIPDVKNIDLAPFTKELAKFASVSVPENIEFVCHVENRDLMISCDPVQLQQSLLNLIVNATHAVLDRSGDNGDSKARIELSTKLVTVPQQLPSRTDLSADTEQAWACISVRDNGVGMNQATRDRVFEPFFTTKPSDIGTGLGLAMVKSYIEVLGGAIDMESAPGSGTCMSIYLPLSTGEHDEVHEKSTSLRQGAGELILVADDNTGVLEALSSILESANYRVLKACNGEHAMALFNEHAEQLDMAILDMVMPKASGMEAARHMSGVRKDFAVVLMTGYDKHEAILPDRDTPYLVLRKPWRLSNLNDVLARSLEKHANGAQASA